MSDVSEFDEAISEIASKHGLAVSKDDPILILQTMNKLLLRDARETQSVMLSEFRSDLESAISRSAFDAKQKAERLLAAAVESSHEATSNTVALAVTAATELIRRECDDAIRRMQQQAQQTKAVGVVNLLASFLTLIAIIVAVITLR